MSPNKVSIQGLEFTRVGDGYLLQTEVESALKRMPAPHVNRLTALLEDIVTAADSVALQTVEAQSQGRPAAVSEPHTSALDDPARTLLLQVRQNLKEQILMIDAFLQRLEG